VNTSPPEEEVAFEAMAVAVAERDTPLDVLVAPALAVPVSVAVDADVEIVPLGSLVGIKGSRIESDGTMLSVGTATTTGDTVLNISSTGFSGSAASTCDEDDIANITTTKT